MSSDGRRGLEPHLTTPHNELAARDDRDALVSIHFVTVFFTSQHPKLVRKRQSQPCSSRRDGGAAG